MSNKFTCDVSVNDVCGGQHYGHQIRPDGQAAVLLAAVDIASEGWWRRVAELGTPFVENLPAGQVRLSFFWRDPYGERRHSPIVKVYADINCVTDHHSQDPQSLARYHDSDLWYWQTIVPADWRGSYSLIPIEAGNLPPVFRGSAPEQERQQRAWWCSLFPLLRHDPLNPVAPHRNSRGFPLSAVHLPAAPDQSPWQALDSGCAPVDAARMQHFEWDSARLKNRRSIWLYCSGSVPPGTERPLVLLLDGRVWAEGLPVFSALEAQTARGELPPALYVLVDSIDMACRAEELPCNALFWQALQQELLPEVAQRVRFSADREQTVLVGQSYGGLAALYAALHWPERFGRVLAQSGSFWWPHLAFQLEATETQPASIGWLTEQVQRGLSAATPLTLFLEAGDREEEIAHVNRQMHQALVANGHRVYYRQFNGGHDAICWRGGLIDGLKILLN